MGVQRARKGGVRSPEALAVPRFFSSLRPLEKRRLGAERVYPERPAPHLPALLRLPCPSSLVYSLRLRPFVSFSLAFLSRLPRLQRKDQRVRSVLDSPALPLGAGGFQEQPLSLGTNGGEGRGGAGDASPGTWAEGRGQIRVALRVNKGGARELGGERRGEGQVAVRDLTGAVPSEGCRACPSSPRKALLVNSSSAHSGDAGPELDSGS